MSGSGFFNSPAYKKIMAKVYGIGAALVLAGALFKIQHYKGAGIMLIVGMGTEIVIFFLSAFEPPHEMPDWSLVFPELIGLEPKNQNRGGAGQGHSGGGDLQALISSGELDQSTIDKLTDGLKKLSNTASSLSNLSDATMATDAYTQSMKSASNSVGQFSTIQTQIVDSAKSLSNSFDGTAKAVSESGLTFADKLNSVSDGFVETVKSSSDELVSAYRSFGSSMEKQLDNVSNHSAKYAEGLVQTNETLSAINSAYELQLNSLNLQVKASKELSNSLEEISGHLNESVSDTVTYKDEVANLSKTLGELNTIYGNMLSAMNAGNTRA